VNFGLTVKKVERLKEKGRHADGGGLYLQVNGSGSKSWVFKYERTVRDAAGQPKRKEHMLGLGGLDTFSLAEARERARALRQKLKDGVDPLAAKRTAKAERELAAAKALTFAQAAQAFFEQHESGWRNAKHRAQFISTLKQYAYPVIGNLPVAAIDTGLVLKVLEQRVDTERGYPAGPFWRARPETASRVRGRIEAVLAWATVRGYRTGDNPARWRGHLSEALPARNGSKTVEHHAALPYAELPAFMADLRIREGVAAQALEFTILTAARTGEVIGARWDEIGLEAGVWMVPAGRMKARKEHRIPLSSRAVELLRDLYREDGNDFVFIGSQAGRGLSNMAMTTVLRRMGRGDITVHGFRSVFRDWAAERTNFPNHVVEAALAHTISDKVEAAYRRGDLFAKRAQLMSAWAKYCEAPAPASAATVLPMKRGRAS
jgi:integrase